MAQLRTVDIWESQKDLSLLNQSQFNLQFAKSVTGKDGNPVFNIVWQSKALAPRTSISWAPVYGLNWTLGLPTTGVSVTVGGSWQECDIGQTYDLNKDGFFQPSTIVGKPDYMNIGKNNFQYGSENGIHILVGIKEGSDWDVVSSPL